MQGGHDTTPPGPQAEASAGINPHHLLLFLRFVPHIAQPSDPQLADVQPAVLHACRSPGVSCRSMVLSACGILPSQRYDMMGLVSTTYLPTYMAWVRAQAP